MEVVNICGINWTRGLILVAHLVPAEGVTLEGTRIVVFGRLWAGNGIDNDTGAVNGAARIERHLWSATASMKYWIIVPFP